MEKNFRGIGPKGYVRSDDRIREDVNEALTRNIWVDATDIEVSVDHGFVYLRGKVTNREQKKEAERCSETIPGVKDVINYLTLRPDRGLLGEMAIRANMV